MTEGDYDPADGDPIERPPLRHIDKYVRPECPCCEMTKRFTVAVLASIGIVKITFVAFPDVSCNINLVLYQAF